MICSNLKHAAAFHPLPLFFLLFSSLFYHIVYTLNRVSELVPNSSIKLSYFENDFLIEFSAFEFTNPPQNDFVFKLENYDENWNFEVNNRESSNSSGAILTI